MVFWICICGILSEWSDSSAEKSTKSMCCARRNNELSV